MTSEEFNGKWIDHLEKGHYGMAIEQPAIVEFMDKEFEKEVLVNPTFTYSRIRRLYDVASIHASIDMYKICIWELAIDEAFKYLKNGGEPGIQPHRTPGEGE
jgi:hypothetical protein